MKITITPNELVERCLWYRYEKYILKRAGKSDEEIQSFLEANQEFELDEKDALVIQFITSIETNNLNHKLNQYLLNALAIHAIQNPTDGKYYIKLRTLIEETNKFSKNFPDYWKYSIIYKKGLADYKKYFKDIVKGVEELDRIKIKDRKNVEHEYVDSTHVKKVLDFVY